MCPASSIETGLHIVSRKMISHGVLGLVKLNFFPEPEAAEGSFPNPQYSMDFNPSRT